MRSSVLSKVFPKLDENVTSIVFRKSRELQRKEGRDRLSNRIRLFAGTFERSMRLWNEYVYVMHNIFERAALRCNGFRDFTLAVISCSSHDSISYTCQTPIVYGGKDWKSAHEDWKFRFPTEVEVAAWLERCIEEDEEEDDE
jgi:hypothetical protein